MRRHQPHAGRRPPRASAVSRARALGLALLAVAGGAAAGCGGEAGPPPLVEYVDLVTEDPEAAAGEEARAFQRLCGDETRYGRPGSPGEPIVVEVALGADPALTLGACRLGPGPAALTAIVSAAGAEPAVAVLDLSSQQPGWQRAELDLARLAGRPAVVRLETAAPAGTQVWISDAFVRHRTPPPEPSAGRAGEAAVHGPRDAAASRPPVPPARRILLISIDTLREDALRAVVSGPERTGPGEPSAARALGASALARLAADGETFTPHVAGSSWTKPSHATLLTGHLAGVHGAGTADGSIRPSVPTLAERLSAAGFATGGVVHDCVWLDPKFGFGRGFGDYRSRVWGTGQLARTAVDWIARHRDEPFFFFLHTFEPHSDFWHLPYEGEAGGATRREIHRRFGVPGYGCRAEECATGLLGALGEGRVRPLPDEPAILRHLYAAGVAATDAELGRLLADLEAMGLYEDLLVVLTSDHGESLLEHGATLHGSWWQEVLRVPLVVKWPGNRRAGTVTRRRTGATDLVPTLLAAAGLPADPDLPGRDLRSPARRPVVSDDGWLALYDGRWKAVVGAAGGDRLYDLAADPGETRDLATERPAELARLAAAAGAWREAEDALLDRLGRRPGGAAPSPLTPEERERLRTLGYLGGGR